MSNYRRIAHQHIRKMGILVYKSDSDNVATFDTRV